MSERVENRLKLARRRANNSVVFFFIVAFVSLVPIPLLIPEGRRLDYARVISFGVLVFAAAIMHLRRALVKVYETIRDTEDAKAAHNSKSEADDASDST